MLSNWISYLTGEESDESLQGTSQQEETGNQEDKGWIWVDVVPDFLDQGEDLLLDKEFEDKTCTRAGYESVKYSDVLRHVNNIAKDLPRRKRKLRLKLLKSKSDEYIMEKYRFDNILSFRRNSSKIPPSRSLEVANYVQDDKDNMPTSTLRPEISREDPVSSPCVEYLDGDDEQWRPVLIAKNRKRRRNSFNYKVARLAVDVSSDKTLLRLFPHFACTGEDFGKYLIDSCAEVPDKKFCNYKQDSSYDSKLDRYDGSQQFHRKYRRGHRWMPYKRQIIKRLACYHQPESDDNKQLVVRQPMELAIMNPYNFYDFGAANTNYLQDRNPFSLMLTDDVEYLPVFPLSELFEFFGFIIAQMADLTARAASVEVISNLSYPQCGIFEIGGDDKVDSERDMKKRRDTRKANGLYEFRNNFQRSKNARSATPFFRINKKYCKLMNKTTFRLSRRISKKALHQMKYY